MKYLSAILMVIFVASCTQLPMIDATQGITDTTAPIIAPTIAPTPTFIEPTSSPMTLIRLDEFTPEMTGVGTHGNMACMSYMGSLDDLNGITLTASFLQMEKNIESSIKQEYVDGNICFEMVDAKYKQDESVSIEIKASSANLRLENADQTFNLGPYKIVPFLEWIYPTRVKLAGPYTQKHLSWDLQPKTNEQYLNVSDVPLLSPVSGCIILVNRDVPRDGQFINVNDFEVYSPQTGYIIQLGHSSDTGFVNGKEVDLSQIFRKEYKPGEQISYLGPLDEGSGYPHTHVSVGVPPFEISCTSTKSLIIDAINKMQVPYDGTFGHIDFVEDLYLFLDPTLLQEIRLAQNQ